MLKTVDINVNMPNVVEKTSGEWESSNPILKKGQVGYDSTEDKYKVGTGSTTWSELGYSFIGVISEKNAHVLRYETVASTDYVDNAIAGGSKIVFRNAYDELPSVGNSDCLYVVTSTSLIYIWDETSLTYKPIGSNMPIPEDELIKLIENTMNEKLPSMLEEKVPPIVDKTISETILNCGDSSTVITKN